MNDAALVHFMGGPLDDMWMVIPEAVDHLRVALEPQVDWQVADLVIRTGSYERDGLPNQPPYVYSWKE